MLKRSSRLSGTIRLFLALMMAVPQGLNVYAEETASPEETVSEVTEAIEEIPETGEQSEETLTVEEEETAEVSEETAGTEEVSEADPEEIPVAEVTEEPAEEVTEEPAEDVTEEPSEEPAEETETAEVTEETEEPAAEQEPAEVLVTLSEADVELKAGESFTFEAVISGTEEELTVVWSTDDTDVISLDETGTVTALKEGIATVKASILDGTVFADAIVKVISSEDAQIKFEENSYELEVGNTVIVSYELTDGAYEDIVWTVSADDIISIDTETDGEIAVEALEPGVIQVTAEIGETSGTFAVVVLDEPDPEYEAIRAVGDTKAVTVTGSYTVTYDQNGARDLAQQLNYYRWNTAKISTLTYDYTIEKYAMQRAAEIVMSYSHTRPDGSSWHTVFDKTVYGQASTTNLNENLLYSGDGAMSTASQVLNLVLANNKQRTCSLYSSNRSFGIGHAVYNGVDYWVMLFSDWPAANTSQTSPVNGSQEVSVKIRSDLYAEPTFSASKTLLKVKVNQSVSLPAVYGKVNVVLGGRTTTISFIGYTVKWTCDSVAKNYASISGSKVIAKGEPNNTETAYLIGTITMNGTSYKVKVQLKVIQPVTGVSVAPTSANVDLGQTVKLTATVKPDNATDKSVTWKSSNTKIATVSSKGVVTAKKGGTCTITVITNDGGFKASSKITVIVHPTNIAFEMSELTMTIGMSEKLVPVFTPADTTDKAVTFTSSDTSKVKIAADGTVTASGLTGSTTVDITVKTHDGGLTATLPVTVKDKDQVKRPTATGIYDSMYEFDLYETSEDFVNNFIKGDGIMLHCDTKDAVLYYTLDGSTPTTSSTKYTGMFKYAGGSTTLKVIAVKPTQMKDSEVAEFKIEEDDEPLWEIWAEDLEKLKDDAGVAHIPSGLWAAAIDEKATYTGGKITFPDIRVYYRNHSLVINQDYKVSYKNNVNVCPEDSSACTVAYQDDGSYKPAKNTKVSYLIITGKGNYQGKTYVPFQIEPIAITEENGFSYQSELYLSLGTKALKPVPVILWNGKKLKNKTDFVVAYSKDAAGTTILEEGITEPGDYYAIISGVKNFTSSDTKFAVPIHVKSEAILLSKATIKIGNVEYTGQPVDPETLEITVKSGGTVLEKGTDYVIESTMPENPTEIGTVSLTIKAAEGSQYIGEKTGKFKITGIALSKAKVYCLGTAVTYTGDTFELKDLFKANPNRPDLNEVTLLNGTEKLVEGTDYTVVVNGQNKGSGTVKFTGIGNYTGTITKKFTVKAKQLTKDDLLIYITDMYFSKSGAKPEVFVFLKTTADDPAAMELDDGIYAKLLSDQTDYSLKYFNNKKMYTDDQFKTKNPPSVSVIFKGNYKGTIANNHFLIQSEDISYMRVTAADLVYSSTRKGIKNYVKPVVYDYQNKKLTINKDYTVRYYYAQDAKVNGAASYNRAYGTAIRETDIPEAGTVIGMEITGIGSYYGTLKAEYKIILKATSLSSSTVTIDYQNGKNKYFEYTGAQIIPAAENLKVTLSKKTLTYGVDYEVQSVTNNVKAGTATMVIHGIGNYGGTKTVKFKIGKQSLILDIGNLIRNVLGLAY